MPTIYVYKNFDGQPKKTFARITQPTFEACMQEYKEAHLDDGYCWDTHPIADSQFAPELVKGLLVFRGR